ncbi:MAG: IclR family transcriptional regulator [Sphingomonas taxi]
MPNDVTTDTDEGPGGQAYAAPALEKGFDILELLATEPGGLTITEIAQRLGLSISRIFRIVLVMQRRRWLQKGPEGDRYTVTYRMLEVAFRATRAQALAQVAAPIMLDLAMQTNQSCHLVIRGESCGTVIQRQENIGPVGFGMRLGASVDLLTSCSGHVLLAFAPEDRRREALATLLPGSTVSAEALAERLCHVRSQGYEMQPSARTAGVTDISYPVFGFDGQIAAALTIPFLVMIDGSQRDADTIRTALADAAKRLSQGLGWAEE